MNPVKERHAKLANTLLSGTKNRTVKWYIDEWGQNRLTADRAGYKITVEQDENAENEPIIIISVRSKDGSVIDSFDDTDLVGETPSESGLTSYWQVMSQLQQTAYRQAVGADDALDKIITDLEDDVPF
jgi:hypothetical protein